MQRISKHITQLMEPRARLLSTAAIRGMIAGLAVMVGLAMSVLLLLIPFW